MDKAAAEKEALRLWRALPRQQRLHFEQASAFAAAIAPTLEFESLGDHNQIVRGWLVRDVMRAEHAGEGEAKVGPKLTADPPTG